MASADKFRAKPTRLYRVKVSFLNANADYTTTTRATNMWNAYWRVQCALNDKSAKSRAEGFPRESGSVSHVNGRDVLTLR